MNEGTSPIDPDDYPITDFSDAVDALIGQQSELSDELEASISLWLDAASVDGVGNIGATDNMLISSWVDLSGDLNHAVGWGASWSSPSLIDRSGTYWMNFDAEDSLMSTVADIESSSDSTIFMVLNRQGEGTNSGSALLSNIDASMDTEVLTSDPHQVQIVFVFQVTELRA